jgi:hypothetical protein
MGQEDACLFVVLDFGLVGLFTEKATDKFEAHSVRAACSSAAPGAA